MLTMGCDKVIPPLSSSGKSGIYSFVPNPVDNFGVGKIANLQLFPCLPTLILIKLPILVTENIISATDNIRRQFWELASSINLLQCFVTVPFREKRSLKTD